MKRTTNGISLVDVPASIAPNHARQLFSQTAAFLLCLVVGLLMAIWPHVIAWWKTGDAAWVADYDDRFYVSVGAQAYANHPFHTADPVRVHDGPSLYKPLPLVPGILLARAGGFGPLAVGIAWRVIAGLTIAAAWFLLLRFWFPHPWHAAAITILLLSDGGLIDGRPVYRQAKNIALLALEHDDTLYGLKPEFHAEWRITTPGLTMAYLIVFLWAVCRARANPTTPRIMLAGLTFGILFHVYFYYWTAAGLALWIAIAIDKGHRRDYFLTGVIGTLIGLPSFVADFLLKRSTSPDWLERTDKFIAIGRFQELVLPKLLIILVPLLLVWILRRRREFIFPGALATSGLILTNHQIITKLAIENFHWNFVWGPVIALLIVCLFVRECGDRARARIPRQLRIVMITSFLMLMFGTGLWLRAVESERPQATRENNHALANYRRQRTEGRPSPLVPNSVVAGDDTFVDFAAIIDNQRPLSNYAVVLSPTVTNVEWEERMALDDILKGYNRADFEARQKALLATSSWGPWADHPDLRARRLGTRLDIFDRVAADMPRHLDIFQVRYVAFATGFKPGYLADRGWRQVESGPVWDVWERSSVNP